VFELSSVTTRVTYLLCTIVRQHAYLVTCKVLHYGKHIIQGHNTLDKFHLYWPTLKAFWQYNPTNFNLTHQFSDKRTRRLAWKADLTIPSSNRKVPGSNIDRNTNHHFFRSFPHSILDKFRDTTLNEATIMSCHIIFQFIIHYHPITWHYITWGTDSVVK
jgi:hypothetical protein